MKLSTAIRVVIIAALLTGGATAAVSMQDRANKLEQQLQEATAIIESKDSKVVELNNSREQLISDVKNMTFELMLPSGLTMDYTATVENIEGHWKATLNFSNVGITATMAKDFMVNGSHYSMSMQEYDLFARTVRAESGGMSEEANIATANVILHRVDSERFPNTVTDVIHQPYQFEVVSLGTNQQQPTPKVMSAVSRAMNGEDVVPEMLGFWAPKWLPAGHELEQYVVEYQIGDHVFSKFERRK